MSGAFYIKNIEQYYGLWLLLPIYNIYSYLIYFYFYYLLVEK